jgi:hypothetical protein
LAHRDQSDVSGTQTEKIFSLVIVLDQQRNVSRFKINYRFC